MAQFTFDCAGRWLGVVRWRRVFAVAVGTVVAALPLAGGPVAYDDPLRPYVPQSAHQAYAHSLIQTRVMQTAPGRGWVEASENALLAPLTVELPWRAAVSLPAAESSAIGLAFTAAAGQRLSIVAELSAGSDVAGGLEVFVDLFRKAGSELVAVSSAPPGLGLVDGRGLITIAPPVLEDGEFVLRLQPELLRSVDIDLRIDRDPLLAFPVSGLDKNAIQSGFGAQRDGGRRAHRGVDIFASRGTAAVAALDGWVTRVDTTPRGGHVVWLRPLFGGMRLYYAHLDSQLVEEGQFVLAGDVIGTIGNTGNAITTPPHLHFGVYLRRRGFRGGARDPFEFL